MVLPFKNRHSHTGIGSLAKGLLRTLDLGSPDPHGAEIDIGNYLAASRDYRAISPEEIAQRFAKYKVDGTKKAITQKNFIKQAVVYMMRDNVLSYEEKADLKHLIFCMGLGLTEGLKISQEAGREIYYDRLKDARADGIIDDSERETLAHIKKIFSLVEEVPAPGVDKPVASAKLQGELLRDFQTNLEQFATVKRGLAKITDLKSELLDLNDFIDFSDHVAYFDGRTLEMQSATLAVDPRQPDAWERILML